jgi:hypothetical protein
LDARDGIGSAAAPIGAGQVRQLTVAGKSGIPADVAGVVLDVTVTNPTSAGYLTVYPGRPRGTAERVEPQLLGGRDDPEPRGGAGDRRRRRRLQPGGLADLAGYCTG